MQEEKNDFQIDAEKALRIVLNDFDTHYGYFRFRKVYKSEMYLLKLSTGGWSENETVISDLEGLKWFHNWWLSQYRKGGHYEFEIPKNLISKQLLKELKIHNQLVKAN